MKSKTVAAIILAATTFAITSCQLFGSKSTQEAHHPFIGQWRIDSIHLGKDSSLNHMLTLMAMKDSSGIKIEFRKDSLMTTGKNQIDTLVYSYDETSKKIQFKDSVGQYLEVFALTDSTLILSSSDSTKYFLKKQ